MCQLLWKKLLKVFLVAEAPTQVSQKLFLVEHSEKLIEKKFQYENTHRKNLIQVTEKQKLLRFLSNQFLGLG